MPLFKKRPFALSESPHDLRPNELVYQIRFTKEIFRSYQEYLTRLNLYRQRVWSCKVSGKTNLTYEEAIVSEHSAAQKVQQFPKEFIAPVLRMVQYSVLGLLELVSTIHAKLQQEMFEGLELHGKKNDSYIPCRILRILHSGVTLEYEVGWLSKDKNILETSILKAEDLTFKKPPVSRFALKVFIRESTSQSSPWVIHEELAKKYGIYTEPPQELKNKLVHENGFIRYVKEGKRSNQEEESELQHIKRRKGAQDGVIEHDKEVPIKYPIDDLLVQTAVDDPMFSKRPPLCSEFRVPMDCVGNLLMVWEFCSSFSRSLHLFPFSLNDFECAICNKESSSSLIGEIHASFLNLLIKDGGEYCESIKAKKQKTKITQRTWSEYLCDFLELQCKEEYTSQLSTVRRGHYSLIEVHLKLSILGDLVEEVIATDALRRLIDERIQQRRELAMTKREKLRNSYGEEELTKQENQIEVSPVQLCENGSENPSSQKEGKKKNLLDQHFERELEKLSIRTSALGKDRNYNMFWYFRRDGRVYMESADSRQWGYYSTKEELDALMGSLNEKGIRERALKKQLGKCYNRISAALEKSSKANKLLNEDELLRRSSRVRAKPKENQAAAFLKYDNKWRET